MTKLSKFYNKDESIAMIKRRYKNCIPSIQLTLKKIVPTEKFQSLKLTLRSQGWKDWHILMGLFNFIMNYRMDKMGIRGNMYVMKDFQEKYPYIEENENSVKIPLREFTEENLKTGLETSMLATICTLGFTIPQNSMIKKEQIYEILEKFNYWEDDVDHEPIFDPK